MKTVIEIIKSNLKAYRSQPIAIFIMFLLPVIFTFYFGFLSSGTDSLNFEIERVKINFDSNGNKIGNDIYSKILTSDEGKKVFNVVDKDEAEIKIVLEKDYDKNLSDLKETKVIMTTQKKVGNFSETITKAFLDESAKSITKIFTEQKMLQNKELSLEKLNKINTDLAQLKNNVISVEKLQPIKTLSKYETTIPGVLSTIVIFLVIFQGLGSYFKEREEGVFQRKLSMPHSRFQIYFYYFLEVFLFGIILSGIYISFIKILNLAFKNTSILNLVIYIILFSLFGALVSTIFTAFSNKTVASMVTIVLMYIQLFLSGDLGFKIFDNQKVNDIYKYSPTKIIGEVALYMQTSNSTFEIIRKMSLPIIVGVVIFSMGYLMTKKSWRNLK